MSITAKLPTSQRYYNLTFALQNGTDTPFVFSFPVRPEELTRTEPSRTSVVNSLDGAWVDSFGRGLATLTLSGNTGWRYKNNEDGVGSFLTLRDKVVHQWHTLRADNLKNNKKPEDVRLIFIDPINGKYVADVVPMSFTLRRSRSQPLLLMYTLVLTVIDDKAKLPDKNLLEPVVPVTNKAAAMDSIFGSIGDIKKGLDDIKGSLGALGELGKSAFSFTKSIGAVLSLAGNVIKTANAAKTEITQVGQVAINFAADLSSVGKTVWSAVAAVTTLPIAVKAKVMQIKSAFTNLECVLVNGYKNEVAQATRAISWYGTSSCSSTTGGSPISPLHIVNPFEKSGTGQLVSTTTAANQAIKDAKGIDIVTTTLTTSDDKAALTNTLNSSMQTIYDGVKCLA